MNLLLVIAQLGGDQSGGGGMIGTLIMFGAIFAIFYFMIIRPQQKRAKEREKLLSAVEKGDKVVLSSGLHGTVAGLEEKSVLIDVGNNVKMKYDRSAIATILKD